MVKTIQGPIKVLLIIHNPGITGPGNILLGTAKYLGPDFQVDVLCPEQGALPDRLTCLGVRVIPFDFSRINDPVYLFTLASRLRREGYHVFHIHSGQLTAFGKLLGVAARVPVIVMTEHVMSSDHHWIKNRLALWLHLLSHRVSNAISDRTIAVSEAARLAHIKRQGVDPASVVTIRNGIDLDEVPPCPAVPASAETVVGSAGRLSTDKGLDILIEAAAITVSRHPEARFLIAGEGPDRASLEARVRELKLEGRMGFPGFQGNMYPFLGECTIYVQPSRDMFESFGLTLVEAMASAKPVVVSDIAAFREIIEEGVTGLFFRPGDAKDLSGKIMLLLDDAKLREKLSCAAREAALLFDIRSTAEKTGGLYKTLLATKGFVLRDRWLDRAREELIAQVRREHDFDGDEVLARVRSEAARFLRFINGKRLTDRDASEYLEYADDFLIELFLQALERGPSVDPVARSNCRLLYRVLGARPVTERDYDERIRFQGIKFQIDNYIEPRDPGMKKRVETVISLVDPCPGEKILDAGCGTGTFAFHCGRRGADCVGLDYSSASVDAARLICARYNVAARFVQCDVCGRLPFPDDHFDKIVSADFVEHITAAQKKAFLAELGRVLKPGGKAVIFTPNRIRESLGAVKSVLLRAGGKRSFGTRLHFGLTDRTEFESLMREAGLTFKRGLVDVRRPYLTRLPFFNEALSLDLVWTVVKGGAGA